MSEIIWSDIDKCSAREVMLLAATFEVVMKRGIRITIKIYEYPEGKFMPSSSHSFWGPKQIGPYESNHFSDSIELALNDAIESLESFDEDEFSNEEVFYVMDEVDGNMGLRYFDGNGYAVSHEEVKKRRSSL